MRAVFVRHFSGKIVSVRDLPATKTPPSGDGWIDVSASEYARQVSQRPLAFYIDEEGELREKKRVTLSVDKSVFKADGEDAVTLRLDLPPEVERVRMRVRDEVIDVPRGEEVIITTEKPGSMRIDLDEVKLALGKPHYVFAIQGARDANQGR